MTFHIAKLGPILEALSEVEAIFEDASTTAMEPQEDDSLVNDRDEDDGEAELFPDIFSTEEIEVAIDVFLSHLIEKEILAREPLWSFATAFEELLGAEHEVVALAENFEERVTGYEGWVRIDEMEEARQYLTAIRILLTKTEGGASE